MGVKKRAKMPQPISGKQPEPIPYVGLDAADPALQLYFRTPVEIAEDIRRASPSLEPRKILGTPVGKWPEHVRDADDPTLTAYADEDRPLPTIDEIRADMKNVIESHPQPKPRK